MDLVCFFFKNTIFRFSKRCSEAWEQYFWDFRFAPKKISRRKNSFVFQRLMFLYQLVNLVLETCFYFLENLKIKQDISVLCFSSRSIIRSTSVMIPLFQIIFGTKMFKKVNSWIFGVFYKVNCGVDIGFLTHLFQKDVWIVDL